MYQDPTPDQRISTETLDPAWVKTKICSKCGDEKSVDDFHDLRGEKKIWKSGSCKECDAKKCKNYREKRHSEGLCVTCGNALHQKDKRVCKTCLNKAIKNNARRRQENKKKAIACLNSKCSKCGLHSEILAIYEFHHLDPTIKEDNFSSHVLSRKWENILPELSKCILVCANCHRIIHWENNNKEKD